MKLSIRYIHLSFFLYSFKSVEVDAARRLSYALVHLFLNLLLAVVIGGFEL